MKSNWKLAAALLAAVVLVSGCGKPSTDDERQLDEKTLQERYYVNMFGFNVMNTYYLWKDEIASALKQWQTDEEPIQKIRDIRYKNAAGEDVDRWTMMTDDFESFTGSVAGVYRTTGLDFQLYYADKSRKAVVGVVTFVYKDSPASRAGLQRGAVFTRVNGQEMTEDNYSALVNEGLYGGDPCKLDFRDGSSVTLTPVVMTEDAVNVATTVDYLGHKVGYLHYTSFTLVSIPGLMQAFGDFKGAGIEDLVLDLRYNGGGYVITCNVLASMIAPLEAVQAGSIFSREVYNSVLTEAWKEDPPTPFQADFGTISLGNGSSVACPAGDFNPDLPRLYVLVGSGTASASESLICGLKPYMDVTVIGRQTHGKYCAGMMIGAPKWFDAVKEELEEGVYDKAKPYVGNWGIYVMYSRYADCNGVTLSMPDGITPDIGLDDDPFDGFALGDPGETMFAAALSHIHTGGIANAPTRSAEAPAPLPDAPHRPGFGVLVGEGR